MQDDRRKIRLPQSYLEIEEQKKREAATVQETYLMPPEQMDGADEPDWMQEFAQRKPVFLPEIPDDVVPAPARPASMDYARDAEYDFNLANDAPRPGEPQTLRIELPVKNAAAPQPRTIYDHQADGFLPKASAAPHGAPQARTPSAMQMPSLQTPPQQNGEPYIARRTMPLADSALQDAARAEHARQIQASAPQGQAAVPAQAAYHPRHTAPEKNATKQHRKASRNRTAHTNEPREQTAQDGRPLPEEAARAPQGTPPQTPPRKKKQPQKKKKHRLLKTLMGFFVCLVLVVCAGLAVYLNIATQNDFLWLDLEQLRHRDATVLYGSDGAGGQQEYARLAATQQKVWVDLENVPQNLQHAFVAIEDQRFYKHDGVSITRTMYAVLNEIKFMLTGTYFGGEDGIKQGASTITQQLVKNLTYDNEAGGIEGYFRKIREIYRAYKLDADYEKDEIMEAYLNVIGFTGNTAGVQAESIKLFNKTVGDLTLEQCASIAAITKNPYRYDPIRNPETHLTRRNYILYEMWQQEYITEEEYNTASAQPIGLEPGAVEMPEAPVTSYFTDKLIEDVSNDLERAYGLSRAETTNLLYNGGLRVYTTVDMGLQTAMEQSMKNGTQFFPQPGIQATVTERDENGEPVLDEAGNPVKKNVTETPQAAMVSVGYDGSLKAVVGGIGEKDISRGFNRGTSAVRQVGSTMKPIGAYALAVENNKVHWSTAVMDSPVRKIEDEATGEMREWPANFTKTYSNVPVLVSDALAESINTVAVRVGERAGVRNIYNFTRNQLGITTFTREDRAAGPMILGSSTYGVTPYELAGSFMMFGNGGSFTTLHSYTDVQTGYGYSLLKPQIKTAQVLSPDAAYVMNRMLKGVMEGSGTAAGYAVRGEMESIGKTGTTSDNRDYWFVGMTPYYVTATWYGYDSGAALNTSRGTHAPTTAWRAVMQQAQRGLEPLAFPVDESVLAEKYCNESGSLATPGCPRTRAGYYLADNLPGKCILHGG